MKNIIKLLRLLIVILKVIIKINNASKYLVGMAQWAVSNHMSLLMSSFNDDSTNPVEMSIRLQMKSNLLGWANYCLTSLNTNNFWPFTTSVKHITKTSFWALPQPATHLKTIHNQYKFDSQFMSFPWNESFIDKIKNLATTWSGLPCLRDII